MTQEIDLNRLQALIEELESADAFERRDAIEALAFLTQQRLGFDWGSAPDDRRRAVRRWRRWLELAQERRQGEEIQATLQLLAQGKLDADSFKKLMTQLPVDQKKALLQQLVIAKAAAEIPHAAAHALCQRCKKRPVTVRVTTRAESGVYEQAALCEVCAAQVLP
ncbi:MAG: hypothetical protein K8T90_19680 [Planctomycetes bacterium]|nr:hypothetical protein [Planctomycetota bacterium]